jgi:hypothetical protein
MAGPGNKARMRPRHQDDVRAKIQATMIIKGLVAHIAGEREMSATQVRAAEILLKKTLPDLASVEHSGPEGEAIQQRVEIHVVDPKG